MASEWGPEQSTLLVTEDDVVVADVQDDHDALDDDPPFSTRGVTVTNFSEASVRVEVVIDATDDGTDDGTSDEHGPAFEEEDELDPESGRRTFGAIEETGSFEVTATTDEGTESRTEWTRGDEARDPDREIIEVVADVGLGIYVRPDGEVEIHEIPEDRASNGN